MKKGSATDRKRKRARKRPDDGGDGKRPRTSPDGIAAEGKLSFTQFRSVMYPFAGFWMVLPEPVEDKTGGLPALTDGAHIDELLTDPGRKQLVTYFRWQCPDPYGHPDLVTLDIEVRKDLRRRGLGSSMVEHFVELMAHHWAPSATHVALEVNSDAEGFWWKMGARPVDKRILRVQPHLSGYAWYISLPLAED